MSDYSVSIGEREYRVKIQHGRLTVDDELLDVDLIPLNGSGMHLLRRNRQALEMHFSHQIARTVQILVEGHLIQAQIRPTGRGGRKRSKASQEGSLSAPMPGLVVEVHALEGQMVEKGALLAVVESMKMQMQMRSAIDGRISRVAVKPGEQVQKGQVLVEVEVVEADSLTTGEAAQV